MDVNIFVNTHIHAYSVGPLREAVDPKKHITPKKMPRGILVDFGNFWDKKFVALWARAKTCHFGVPPVCPDIESCWEIFWGGAVFCKKKPEFLKVRQENPPTNRNYRLFCFLK